MKRKHILLYILLAICFLLWGCAGSKNSSFSIQFIDVGQGDSALIECDGQYMLIDAGDEKAGDAVYRVLEEQGIQRINILVMSHLHDDHIGGLVKALTYASSIKLTLSNADKADTNIFKKVERQLNINGTKIKIPHVGDKYSLGSAKVEVVDVASENPNDSLVLLVTYGKTRFLFTGDIEEKAQERIYKRYANDSDDPFKVDLIKMPHHGAYTGTLYTFLRTFMPDYVVISVGENTYGHPSPDTLKLLDSKTWKPKVYRTDKNGNIIVRSNGESIQIETGKR